MQTGSKTRGLAITVRGFQFLLQDHDGRCRRCRPGRPCVERLKIKTDQDAARRRESALPVLAADNVGESDRWQDPRDISGGETDPADAAPL